MYLERNVFGVLERSANAAHRDDRAFSYSDGGTQTFAELHGRATSAARAYVEAGVVRGDRVAVLMNNRREWVETFFALAAIGAICVPVNVLLMPTEIDRLLQDSGARALVYDDYSAARVAELTVALDLAVAVATEISPAHAATRHSYEQILGVADPTTTFEGPDLHDPFLIIYTSGTTGAPKGAVHSHNGVLWSAIGQWTALGLDRTVRAGVLSSLSWAAGFHVLVTALVWIGGSSHIRSLGGATPDDVTAMLVEREVTHTFLVPSLLNEILARPDLIERLHASRLRWILTGSAPVPKSVLERFHASLPDIALCQGYGFSEFPAVVTVLEASEALDHLGSAGRPMPISTVAVRRADGSIAARGDGELLVRSYATMIGYHDRPDATEQAFRDGWFHTGDLATIDEDGYVTITGRLKELIISGGLNIYPKEIEDVIHGTEGVLECAVVGVFDEKYGEAAAAVIIALAPEAVDVAKIREVCAATLAGYKRPKHYLVRSEPLPRNANFKILKRDLVPWATAQIEGR